jgi:hypothetical protein
MFKLITMEKKYNPRYYLHRKAKQFGFSIDSRKRIVFCPTLYDTDNPYLLKLIEIYKYVRQLQII